MSTAPKPSRPAPDLLFLPREFAGLKPDEKVLDIGCGKGAMALAMTKYLSQEGAYEGFDVVPERIELCRERVGPEHTNFNFKLLDVANKKYNPEGEVQADSLRFPYGDDEFDLAMLFSVFTHMLPADVEHYFAEITRVLKPGGRMLATYFLLNEDSLGLMEQGAGGLRFDHDFGNYRIRNPDIPEGTLAYREEYVLGLYERFGLRLSRPVEYSGWAAKQERPWGQDVIVAEKA
jgi:SAM-dependent methyltransferase